jgi:cytochrome b561
MANQSYSPAAVVIHWLLAVCIFFLFASSSWMLALPLSSDEFPFRQFPFQLHKNIGVTIIFLLALLLYIRFRRLPYREARSKEMESWVNKLATVDHVVLYLLVFACCASGYAASAYSGWPTTLWWTLKLPHWGRDDKDLNMLYSDIHAWTCWSLLGFLAVHVAGAVYHAFQNDGVVRRMMRLR